MRSGCARRRVQPLCRLGRAVAVAAFVLATRDARAETFRVTSDRDGGAGSLREAIRSANAAPGSTVEVSLGDASVIVVERALPELHARGVRVEGHGVTLREGDGCERPGGRRGCDGLVLAGPAISVRDVAVAGFTFDGIAVRGGSAREVRIEHVQAIDNLDDGIGVSDGAGPVRIERCLLMGNGFRSKGKGLLAFDRAEVSMRDSDVIANRDGITVTRDSSVTLERVIAAANYDKGVGVSAARLVASGISVVANGRAVVSADEAPNADGVRVGLGGEARLFSSLVAGNGDTGLVVLDTSRVELRSCRIEANRGASVAVAPTARLSRQ